MKVRRIKACSMHEALDEARRQLGSNAAILHTKQYEDPVWFGLRRRRGVEILAAVDELPRQPVAVASAHGSASGGSELNRVCRDISEIRHALENLSGKTAVEERPQSPAVERLVKNGVPEKLAASLLANVGTAQDFRIILDILSRHIRCSGPIRCSERQVRAALVGPTGAGKTTTAAKLAAQHWLVHKQSVALITLDTYRVGAVEQLATYARILNLPLEVAFSPADVEALVAKHADKELIIIDTVGRSQRNREQLSELAAMLRSAKPTEVHLVVSASASSAVQKEAVDSFSSLSATRLILTKLDECPQTGCILELAANSLMPFSYITYGQEVPDDIAAAESKELARLVWEGAL
jgi:flagellar biosynthesis protein FlhF